MKKNKFKRGAAAAMAAVMLCGAIPAQAFTYDIAGHQAEQIMKQWIEEGYMVGDGNGYHPDQEITRAEFMTFANKVLKLTEEAAISQFKDVQESAWYYHEVAKAHKAGYTSGTSGTTMSPNAKITNQEMYLMLAAMTTGLPDGDLSHVADRAELAPWAEKGVREGISEGYIAGRDGKIAPNHKVTRSEAIVFLDRYKTDSRTFSYPGAYSVGTVAKVTVQSNGVTLKSAKIQGDLVLGKDVDSVVLDKVTVGGQIIKENPNTRIMEPGQWMDGKYEGRAKGDHGQVHVTVTFKDGRITDVKLGKHMEGEQGEKVMQSVLDQIVKTGDVKKIKLGNQSGINAKAALNAVRDAAAQANGQTVQAGESSFAKEFTVLRDGTYMGISNGYGGKIKVELVVKNHKIDSLTLLHHTETPEYMVITEKILGVIARNGGVEGVDTITGATVTADALIYASADALSQSYGMTTAPGQTENAQLKPAEHNPDMPQGGDFEGLVDGVYHGHAAGYGGDIKVTVTVRQGRVAQITVDEHNETPEYFVKMGPLLDRIVKNNSSDVDTITGATDTSHGILAAVENALSDFIEIVPYADGVWYGQGRGYYPNDKYGNGQLLRTSSDVAVTVKDGHVTDVAVMYHGDDETYGGYLQEDFDTFKQYIIDHNGTEGIIDIMNGKQHGNPVYDAVSGATMSARGYVAAIDDALNRAHKFARDGREQTIRSLTLLNNPGFTVPPTQFYYGEDVDLSGLKVLIKYRDGREETVPFDQLQSKGVDCSLNQVFTPQPANGDYSEETNYDLVFVDPISTAEHRSQLQAKRMKVYREIARIEVKTGAGETIVVEPNARDFAYEAKVNGAEIGGIESVRLFDTDGRAVELEGYTVSSESGEPVMRIELSPLPAAESSDPYKLAYRYNSYKLKLDVETPFNKDSITEFHLTTKPRHEYQEGDALNLENVAIEAIDSNYKSEELLYEELADYGFTVAREDGTPVESGMILDKVEKFNIVISHPDAESVKIAIEVAPKKAVLGRFEIHSVEGDQLLAVINDPLTQQEYGELYVTLSGEYFQGRETKVKLVGYDTNGKVMDLEPEWFLGSIMVMADDFSYVIIFEEGEAEKPEQIPTGELARFEVRTVADDKLVATVEDPASVQKYGELYVSVPAEYAEDPAHLLKVVAVDTAGCEMKQGDPAWFGQVYMSTMGDISYMIFFEKAEDDKPAAPTGELGRFEIRSVADDTVLAAVDDPAAVQEYGELYLTLPAEYFEGRAEKVKLVGLDTAGFEMELEPEWFMDSIMVTVGDISYVIIFSQA